jgi:CBS domain-containing protein
VVDKVASDVQSVQAIMEFLSGFPPFDALLPNDLKFLASKLRLRYYAMGEVVVSPDNGPVTDFFIVKQGQIHGERQGKTDIEVTFDIGVGECFPVAALMGQRATRTLHRASTDCFCYALNHEDFAQLLTRSEIFRDFAVRGVSLLLERVSKQMQGQVSHHVDSNHSLNTPLAKLILREPVVCDCNTSVQQAVQRMHQENISSVVIVDANQRPVGIFTLRDLRRAVASGQLNTTDDLALWMTASPIALNHSASAFDALLIMTERQIAHLLVVQQGRLLGVLAERDLFALQRINLVDLVRRIRRGNNLAVLKQTLVDLAELISAMLSHGASATQVTTLITQINDHVLCRVLELRLSQFDLADINFSWICFGSEGRREQTLLTDQDNGIVFEVDNNEQSEGYRQRLLPFAYAVNQDLDHLGFTWCKGNVMASNPDLCRSVDEWQHYFDHIIRVATPENLLAASIYFDARIVWGNSAALERVIRQLFRQAGHNTIFQFHLASAALNQRPPLGRFRDFVLQHKAGQEKGLDLKVQGLTPFVDAARLLALVHGVAHTNTLDRLQQLVDDGVVEASDGAAYIEAYGFIQLLRLQQHQAQVNAGRARVNVINPDRLNPLDRRILRESLRQAKRLQASISQQFLP